MKPFRTLLVILAAACPVLMTPSPVRGEDTDTARARQLFQDGQKQFDLGNWDAAVRGFSQAYELRPDPKLLYNMAQAYRRGGNARRAIDLYKNFLIKDPKTSLRAEVEERIRVLQRQVEEEEKAGKHGAGASEADGNEGPTRGPGPRESAKVAPTPEAAAAPPSGPQVEPPPLAAPASEVAPPAVAGEPGVDRGAAAGAPMDGPPAPAAEPPAGAADAVTVPGVASPAAVAAAESPRTDAAAHRLRLAGLVVGGLGVASAGAGVFFSYRTHSLSDSVSHAARFNPGDAQSGKNAEIAQWICYGTGAALAVAGGLLYWRGRARARQGLEVSLAPWLTAAGGGLGATGAF